jgi:hypothetical protein
VATAVARLLIVHHTPSPALHSLFTAVRDGATDPRIDGVEVVTRPALTAAAADVLTADGIIVGGPVNLGYLAGALKHFFDQAYYPCLEETVGRPFGAYLHGNDDLGGGRTALERITTGLRWRRAAATVEVTGTPRTQDLEACWELGAVLAAGWWPERGHRNRRHLDLTVGVRYTYHHWDTNPTGWCRPMRGTTCSRRFSRVCGKDWRPPWWSAS